MPAGRALTAQCCIVGGGPAGMMLGFLLARAGVRTVVLEKHADFLRDFRGDTVHPSTLRVIDELGLLDEFLKLPHQKLHRIGGLFGDRALRLADFSGLPERYAFIAFMPQWDFLDFLADVGRFEVRAPLTVGCDGRHSTVRQAAGLPLEDVGAPIDVMWFRVARDPDDFDDTLARVTPGRLVVTIDRGDYWQCAFVIAKGGADALRARGLDAFRADVAQAAPVLAAHVGDIASWDDVKLLSVSVDRLTRWSKPGLLCIGDAAHAMSPVGGVGINLAIQDAVATANALAVKLRDGTLEDDDLDRVRRRRLFPTRATQALQVQIQSNVLAPVVTGENAALEVPIPLRLLTALPALQRLFARVLGLGFRSEHVESPIA